MPCYLFSYHAHASWFPDHRKGYVHREHGIQPTDKDMARNYRSNQRNPAIAFTADIQRTLIETIHEAAKHLEAVVHAIGTEPTHVHALVSWTHSRDWFSIRRSLRSALSRALNNHFEKREWFTDGNSRKRVEDYEHFDYLLLTYLPAHRGETWTRDEDRRNALLRDAKRPPHKKQLRKKRARPQ